MAKPKVSIVVPSYNHGRFLRQRLDTILSQTYQGFEIFVLDDASTDDTREILAGYATRSRVEVVLRQKNGGSVFRQWNAGVDPSRKGEGLVDPTEQGCHSCCHRRHDCAIV